MSKRTIRTLDQRIADAKRELEALEVKKRVRDDAILKAVAGMVRRLDSLAMAERDNLDRDLLKASDYLELYLNKATHKPAPALPFEEPGS